MTASKPVLLLTGPTASGKSALAVQLARATGGAIVNADSQQVYADLRIVSARPTAEEEAQAPHLLYGHVAADVRYTTGAWLREVTATIRHLWEQGVLPILTGGTGLYFRSLVQGLAHIPPVPATIAAQSQAHLEKVGLQAFYAQLVAQDPLAAALDPTNPQRLVRAWAVWHQTGRSIVAWQQDPMQAPLPEAQFLPFALVPERETIYRRANARVHAMVEAGVLDEIQALLTHNIPATLPILKSHGVPEFAAVVRGEMRLEDAIAAAQQNTRKYIKRQITWLKHQPPTPTMLSVGDDVAIEKILKMLRVAA